MLKIQYLQILIALKNQPEYQLNPNILMFFLNFLKEIFVNYSDLPFPIYGSEVSL